MEHRVFAAGKHVRGVYIHVLKVAIAYIDIVNECFTLFGQ
jgi:hypothetical protein